ncbi:hypothetical protein CYMTET_13692 [Cymbomonas tetramitiformis]|uniref:Uncharacterized protein n=1 Tax=Cymbomonas tetramitiformis TaxID=36881 RepID=A0AAE0GI34_9CHLO|nr:hypothetical protein CYMTET_13692 [Cymbomonas tetramitiformis]
MDLEAVDKTVEAFLRGLTRKVVCLYFDKQAVVATQSHFMSHNPDVWWDPYCEGVNALAYSWRGRGALDQPAVGTAGEVAHKLRATGARLWRHTGLANPGSGSWSQSRTSAWYLSASRAVDREWRLLTEQQARPNAAQPAAEVMAPDEAPVYERNLAQWDRWRDTLGESQDMELAVRMQAEALRESCGSARTQEQEQHDLGAGEARARAGGRGRRDGLAKEKGRNHEALQRRLAIPWWGVEAAAVAPGALDKGVMLQKVYFLGGWSYLSLAAQAHIEFTAVPDWVMRSFFGWLAPMSVCVCVSLDRLLWHPVAIEDRLLTHAGNQRIQHTLRDTYPDSPELASEEWDPLSLTEPPEPLCIRTPAHCCLVPEAGSSLPLCVYLSLYRLLWHPVAAEDRLHYVPTPGIKR